MNVINKLTLRHLLLNKKRTLVTIIGVILSVSMITAVTTFVVSAQDMMIRDAIQGRGYWHANFSDIEADKADVFLDSPHVEQAMFMHNLGYAELEGSTNEFKPYLFVQEFDAASMENLALDLIDGRFPERSDELVVSEHIGYNAGVEIAVGDTLELAIGQRYFEGKRLGQDKQFMLSDDRVVQETLEIEFVREYTVVGVVARPTLENRSAPGYTVFSYFDRDNLATAGVLDVWMTFANVSGAIYEQGQELAAAAGVQVYHDDPLSGERTYFVRYNSNLLSMYGVTDNPLIGNVLNTFALIAIVIIMVGSVALIYNAFAISISERSRQLGMLASVGATRRQKKNSVFFEGLVIGLVGIPLGLFAGIGGMGVTFYFVDPIIANLMAMPVELRLVVSSVSVAVAVLFSALTILISVWIPARRAAKITPIEAIRQTRDVKLSRRDVRTSWLTRWLFGFEGELALKNLKRNRRRYRATVVSLTVSIVLFLTVSSYANFATVGSNMYTQGLNYDLSIYLGNVSVEEQQEFYRQVMGMEAVAEYLYEQTLYASMELPPERVNELVREHWEPEDGLYTYSVYLHSLDDAALANYAQEAGVPLSVFSDDSFGAIAFNLFRAHWDDMIVESEAIKARVGDVLEIDLIGFGEESHFEEVELVAFTGHAPMGSSAWGRPNALTLVVQETVFDAMVAGLPENTFANDRRTLYVNSPEPIALEAQLRELLGEQFAGDLHINNQAKAAQEERQFVLLVMIFITGFIVLITLICIANIFNTVSTSIGLRRREFAMLKSVGMTPEGFNRMIRYESVFYGIKALLFGLPIGFGINYLLYMAMSEGFLFAFTMPWQSYIVVVVAVFAVVFTTMLYASARIKKENIIDALRDENM
ncbi:MAG: ABC transporter permease [Firmicutes bacterium]|nr:ABC transporter permease [Bacillota bacterium]